MEVRLTLSLAQDRAEEQDEGPCLSLLPAAGCEKSCQNRPTCLAGEVRQGPVSISASAGVICPSQPQHFPAMTRSSWQLLCVGCLAQSPGRVACVINRTTRAGRALLLTCIPFSPFSIRGKQNLAFLTPSLVLF